MVTNSRHIRILMAMRAAQASLAGELDNADLVAFTADYDWTLSSDPVMAAREILAFAITLAKITFEDAAKDARIMAEVG